jgi:hypothetical protein
MVIDLDAHQGNGTNAIFAGDRRVFTYSVHVGKNYPSAKVTGSMDVELPRYVGADDYFDRLEATLPRAIEAFEPDVVFYIGGADVHADDRFGQMGLGTADVRRRDEWTIGLCRRWSITTEVHNVRGNNNLNCITKEQHCQTVREPAERIDADPVRDAAPRGATRCEDASPAEID